MDKLSRIQTRKNSPPEEYKDFVKDFWEAIKDQHTYRLDETSTLKMMMRICFLILKRKSIISLTPSTSGLICIELGRRLTSNLNFIRG